MASDGNAIAQALSRRAPAFALGVMLSVIGCVASPALADQLTVTPLKDNTIYGESNDLSNGAGTSVFAGVTAMSAIRRALLAFDVAGTVPAGSTITSAQLVLQVTRSAAGNEPETLHRLLADWGEGTSNANGDEGQGAAATTGDATWRFRVYKSDRWTTQGGDFVAEPSAMQGVPDSGPVTFGSTAQMVADAQDWLDEPSTNFGWIIVGNEDHHTTAKRFASRESPSAATRPKLVIEFEPPGSIGTPTPSATTIATPTASPAATTTPTATPPIATATQTATMSAPPAMTPSASAEPTETATGVPTTIPSVTQTPKPTATVTPSVAPTDTVAPATATAPATLTPTPANTSPTVTPTTAARSCVGDCDGDGHVAINELIAGVGIALGAQPLDACRAFDANHSGTVTIDELIAAVTSALSGCPSD